MPQYLSEEHVTSIFRVKEQASMNQLPSREIHMLKASGYTGNRRAPTQNKWNKPIAV
jgi:hypothetical protein